MGCATGQAAIQSWVLSAQKSDANAQASSTHLLLDPEQHGCECGNDFARRWQDLS